jgi:hypothetical protein
MKFLIGKNLSFKGRCESLKKSLDRKSEMKKNGLGVNKSRKINSAVKLNNRLTFWGMQATLNKTRWLKDNIGVWRHY